jgi:hypothetical protein
VPSNAKYAWLCERIPHIYIYIYKHGFAASKFKRIASDAYHAAAALAMHAIFQVTAFVWVSGQLTLSDKVAALVKEMFMPMLLIELFPMPRNAPSQIQGISTAGRVAETLGKIHELAEGSQLLALFSRSIISIVSIIVSPLPRWGCA